MKFEKLAQSILNESPALRKNEKTKINLDDLAKNKAMYENLLKNYVKRFDNFQNLEVYYSYDNTGEYLFHFVKDEIIEAVFGVEVVDGEALSGAVIKRKTLENKHIIDDIFWIFLPMHYDSIISDYEGNEFGKDLWKKLVTEALNRNLKVTIVHKSLFDKKIYNEIPFEKEKFEEYWVSKFLPSGRFDSARKKLFKIYFREKDGISTESVVRGADNALNSLINEE